MKTTLSNRINYRGFFFLVAIFFATHLPAQLVNEFWKGFVPSPNDSVLHVKIRFYVYHPNLGDSDVWAIPNLNSHLDSLVTYANHTYSTIPSPIIYNGVTTVPDARLHFEVASIQHATDSLGYYQPHNITFDDGSGFANDAIPVLLNLVPTLTGGINLIAPRETGHLVGRPGRYIRIGFPRSTIINGANLLAPDWLIGFSHELGHVLGLEHSHYLSHWSYIPINSCNDTMSFPTDHAREFPGSNCSMVDNLMNESSGCLKHLSPGQLSVMHYFLRTSRRKWLTPKSQIDATTANHYHDYVVGSNPSASGESWIKPRFFKGNVIVPAGKWLTINCLVAMQNKGKIIVEPGAKLLITGDGHVTNISGRNWEGIDVLGNSSQNQNYYPNTGYSSTQAVLKIENGGKLSRSINAIRNYGYHSNGSINYSSTGGIVLASNAVFQDNVRDVEFLAYPMSKSSITRFTDCSFIATDTVFGDSTAPYTHVTLWGIKGIKFQGCKFLNDISYGVMGEGIHSLDAIYEVSNSSTRSCEFTNLDKGISAYNANRLRAIYVIDSKFKNNHNGIILSSVDGAYLGRNTFTITGYANSVPQHGVYLNDCKNYVANSNTLTSNSQSGSYGFFAAYSGTGTHKIFRNTFSNLYGAVMPLFDNSGLTNTSDGLLINCNIFNSGTSNVFDVAQLGNNGGNVMNVPTVASWQGDVNNQSIKKVRNQYGASCTSSNSENKWLINVPQKIVKHPANSSPSYMMPTPQPNCSNVMVQLSPGPAFNFNAHCPESEANPSGSPIAASNLATAVSAAKATFQTMHQVWSDSLDNGNSANLYSQITSTANNSSYKTALLLQASPYISDEVQIAYFTNSTISDAQALTVHSDIAPVSATVWDAIVAGPWGSATMTEFENQQNASSSSARDALESELVYSKNQLQGALTEKLRYFMADTIEHALDSVIETLSTNFGVELPLAKVKLAQAYLDGGYTTRAFEYADSLKYVSGYGDLMSLQINLMKLDTSTKRFMSLDDNSVLRSYFSGIAPDTTKAGAWQARALLNYIYNTNMNFTFLYPEESGERAAAEESELSLVEGIASVSDLEKQFLLYPNPAGNSIYTYRSGATLKANRIEFLNILGQPVFTAEIKSDAKQEFNVSDLANGMYFVNLYNGEQLLAGKKFFISR